MPYIILKCLAGSSGCWDRRPGGNYGEKEEKRRDRGTTTRILQQLHPAFERDVLLLLMLYGMGGPTGGSCSPPSSDKMHNSPAKCAGADGLAPHAHRNTHGCPSRSHQCASDTQIGRRRRIPECFVLNHLRTTNYPGYNYFGCCFVDHLSPFSRGIAQAWHRNSGRAYGTRYNFADEPNNI